MFRIISKYIRSNIKYDTKYMCYFCLEKFSHQTKCGKLLCEKCNKEYEKKTKLG